MATVAPLLFLDSGSLDELPADDGIVYDPNAPDKAAQEENGAER